MAQPLRTGYRPDIDGLRAIAILPVLLFHSGVPGFTGGYVGVDVFFVISGYLITGHLAAEAAAGHLSILRFYARRVRRIAPALFLTLAVTGLVAALLLLPSALKTTSAVLMAAAASVSNIYLWKAANYFAADSAYQPLLHTWSLSVEEQFYAFIPLTMLVFARPLRQRWTWLFLPLTVISFALSVFLASRGPTADFYLLPTRAWELGIGALLATAGLPVLGRRAASLVGLAGLAMVLAPIGLYDETTPFPGWAALAPCLGSALLIYVGPSGGLVTRWLSVRPLVAVGLISYSLYLVHWPIIVFTHYRSVAPLDALQIVTVILASLAVATLSWRFVEMPFRRPSPALTQPRLLWGGLAGIAVLCLFGYLGVRGNGFPGRFPDFAERVIPGHAEWKTGTCFLYSNPNVADWSPTDCTRIATGPSRVLLWGDSFAAQYVPGILANADALHATVLQYTTAGCPPVLSYVSYARPLCTAFNAHALDVIREQHIDTVILAGRWTDLQQRGLGELRTTLNVLEKLGGIRVITLGQSPEFSEDVQVISFLKGNHSPDAVNRWRVFFDPAINGELAAIADSTRFINPMPALCTGAECVYEDRGAFLFEDYGHYSAEGSARVVKAIFTSAGVGL